MIETYELSPRELVILAEDYDALVAWYIDVLGFRKAREFSQDYRYANLETSSGIRLGIAPASEMDVEPSDRSNSHVILQMGTRDVAALFEHVASKGGAVQFGPAFDEKGGFWFGAIADPEGNPIWVVDENCP